MKKVLLIILGFFAILIVAAAVLPIIFKDDIRAAIDKELDKNLNAQVYYSPDDFSLSLFRSFPNLSVNVSNFGVVGNAPFEQDTLASIGEFGLTLDIMSVIRGDQIKIVNVGLEEPRIHVIVLADGTANYDIAKSTGEAEDQAEESGGSAVNIQIQGWEINNGRVVYDDRSLPMLATIDGLTHSGSGDFAQDVFDMSTNTTVDQLTIGYDGIEYITNKRLSADLIMAMDFANMKFTFKENHLALNDFGFLFEGFLSMPSEDINMDIQFKGEDINLKSVLSLVPGVYQEYMDGVTAAGAVSFAGSVSGTYNEESMPQIFAEFGIADGKVNYAEYPIPMEDIQIHAKLDYPSADLAETSLEMDKFHLTLDGEEVTSYLYFENLEDYYWDFRLNGNLDLEKLTKVVKLEDTELRGLVNGSLTTKGRMSDLEAEQYEKLPTEGSVSISDFYYQSPDLPQGFGIADTRLSFDPEAITLDKFKGNAGKTDLQMDGQITNYLQYALGDSTTLYGRLNFSSDLVDLNEWMTDTEEPVEEEVDTSGLEVVRIPTDVDFVLTSNIAVIKYDNLDLKNFDGEVVIRDGALKLNEVGFNLLDGAFVMNGAYESAPTLAKPLYNFDFEIKELSIPSAFQSFVSVQKLVPVAKKMNGKFSTDLQIGGSLGADMMPVYEDMQGAGLLEIANASLENVKLLSAISNVSKLNQSDGEVSLRDVLMSIEVKDGRIHVAPFDFTIGGRTATVSGSSGVDGSLDYAMSMDVPSGDVGQALNSAISSFAGIDNAIGKDITLNLGIGGTYDDPSVKLLSAKPGADGGQTTVKAAVKEEVKQQVDQKKEELKEELDAKKEEVKEEVQQKVDEKKEEAKQELEEKKEEVKDKAKDAVKDLFNRKKKDDG
ncbi:AsmA family protein [Marinoscillum furvescens]|uniref:AsmA-like protein n=1 Tax=Marinoscillum furvescens DSM 4134 TaxID=1122208 RepID=A0A3D9L2G7_MARFU|nr:AsmA-like C-terminal region-containing protein [Marinoscillum furvescens]RED98931.1 AsmA-like protein [Marinoscillum furvescens DSM 4134]